MSQLVFHFRILIKLARAAALTPLPLPLAWLLFVILSNCRQKSYYAGHKLPSWRTFCELDSRRNGSKWATNCLFTRNYAKSPSTGKEFLKSDAGPEWWNELHSLAPRRQGLYAICPSAPPSPFTPLCPAAQQSVCFLIRLHFGCISNATLPPALSLSLLAVCFEEIEKKLL